MQFIRSAELRPGLRIAKPIYNKDGVLLYERNSRLTIPAINSIRNFDLIGIYILEPAEPVPPFTREDLEFEQAQTVYLFKLKDLFEKIYKRQPLDKLEDLVDDIIKRYGSLTHRVNFNQNLRSAHDFMYKHATSVAILTAMIGQHIDMPEEDFKSLITAAVLYGFGYRFLSKNVMDKEEEFTEYDNKSKQAALEKGTSYLSMSTDPISFLPKAIRVVEYYILSSNPERKIEHPTEDVLLLAEILKVAVEFDMMTGMIMGHKPESEIVAMNSLRERTNEFNETIVHILAQCIHIIPTGASVDLNNGEKAVVLVENQKNYMEPVILRLRDNNIYDLSDPTVNRRIQIVDIMKTMDNRVEIDVDTIRHFKADKRIQEMTKRYKEQKEKAESAKK
ncbi:MAG: phosphohydrolase [Agathobacter sp.]|nr:phosphohydrolase [Agathobacter sp.]